MHLGIYHEPIHTNGSGFDTYGPYARYVLEFARHFEKVTVFAPITEQPTYFSGIPLDAPNLSIVPLPFFMTHIQAYKNLFTIYRTFKPHADQLDAINARGTAPLAYLLWWLTRKRNVPFIYHFASDPFEILSSSPKYHGLFGNFARIAYNLEFQIQKIIMRKNYSFTSGEAIYERLKKYTPNIEPMITSSLTDDDYTLRDDTCQSQPIRVLFVGNLRQEKGVDFLIDTIKILRDKNRNVELDIVGDGIYRQTLTDQANRLGIQPFVHFHGFAVMGPALNTHYNSADIFCLPSLSEGSPKVVLEALAHSLPVVATKVGNIPQMLDNGNRGILVPTQNAEALAQAIVTIIDNKEFRQRCIHEGFNFARQHHVSTFVARMADTMKAMVLMRQQHGENSR
jgi:glycosyltransferase involved in cell wall biosynthesis